MLTDDCFIGPFVSTLSNAQVRIIGPELILGKVYEGIGFSDIWVKLFCYLVLTRLINFGSKLKTMDNVVRCQGI